MVGRVLALVCGGASIVPNPDEDEAGHCIVADPWTTCRAWDDRGIYRRDHYSSAMKARILAYMAGREAEQECIGRCEGGDSDDLYQIAMMLDSLGVAPIRRGMSNGCGGSLAA